MTSEDSPPGIRSESRSVFGSGITLEELPHFEIGVLAMIGAGLLKIFEWNQPQLFTPENWHQLPMNLYLSPSQSSDRRVMYFEACLEEAGDDAAFIAKALGTIARARGMAQLARDTGLGRESLYKALSGEGNSSFATILKVMHALGLSFHATPRHV